MKQLLITTIGNRDLQFKAEDKDELPESLVKYLTVNPENKDYLIIEKSRNESKTFLENSQLFETEYKNIETYIQYPLIQVYIENSGLPDKIILVPTDQYPNRHKQDTVFIAKILQSKLNNELNLEIETQVISDARDDRSILDLFDKILKDHINKFNIHFNTSGGLPSFRINAYMASLFKDRVSVVNYVGQEGKVIATYNDYQKHSIKTIVEKMLDQWDYAGILNLPKIPESVKTVCRFAIARSAHDLDQAHKIKLPFELKYPLPDLDDIENVEREWMYSAYIKYKQQNYADFLFRIFTFHDNMFIPHIENLLGESIEFDNNNNHKAWNEIFLQPVHRDLLNYLNTYTLQGDQPLRFSEPSKHAYVAIIKYYKDVQGLNDNKINQCKRLFDRLSHLTKLRNKAAHYYFGINEEKVLNVAQAKSIRDVTNKIDRYLGTQFVDMPPYKELNERILELLSK